MEIDYYTNLLVNISHTSHVSFLNISFVRSTRVVVNLYYIFFIIYAQGLEVKNISYNNLSKKLRICVFAFLRSYHARHVSTCRAFPPPLSPFLPNLTYRNRCAGCHFVLETRNNSLEVRDLFIL